MINLFLVDDQPLILSGLTAILELESDFEVVGTAENGQTAIAEIAKLQHTINQPHVVLMDVRMPIMDGVATTRYINQNWGSIKVIVLTTFDDDQYVKLALQYGATGYLLKNTPADEIAQVIRTVNQGYTQLGPTIIEKAISGSVIGSVKPRESSHDILNQLTPRELEIIHLISTGANNREISEKLGISEKTVKNHITNILSRLQLRDRTSCALWYKSQIS